MRMNKSYSGYNFFKKTACNSNKSLDEKSLDDAIKEIQKQKDSPNEKLSIKPSMAIFIGA